MTAIKDVIEFANENPVCFLATDEKGQPRVRALGFWFADETGFYFQTIRIKDLYKQIALNPKVEVCFYKPGPMAGKMLRIAGEIEILKDLGYKEKVLADRPFLKDMGVTSGSKILVLFRVAHGTAHFWTMENNLKPKEIVGF